MANYVISATNLPLAPRGRGADASDTHDVLDRLQSGTTLQLTGRAPAKLVLRGGPASALFFLACQRIYLPLTAADREIIFKLETAQMVLQTKLDAKEMMYHGTLAV